MVKNPPAVRDTRVHACLDWEDPLEEEMATHLSILAWEIPWTEEPGGLQSMRSKKRYHFPSKQQPRFDCGGQPLNYCHYP